MHKTKIVYTLFGILFLSFIPVSPVFADSSATGSPASVATSTPENASSTPLELASSTLPTVLGLKTPLIPTILAQIKQAKITLAQISLKYSLNPIYKKTKKGKSIISGYNLGSKDIALAIADPTTNLISLIIGKQNGKSMVFSDPNIDVSLTNFNGVNSKFLVNKPAGGVVVALKYLISGKDTGSKKTIENGLSEAVYVPYSNQLSSQDVINYGANYLNGIIKTVALSLQNFPSRSIPGKTITEAIPPAMIKSLVYAEHTDTTEVLYGGNIQNTINKLNILFATNEGDAYKYSVSTAAARGIAQFIPSTYASLVQRHPEAGLISDFAQGMSDHTNSIKAMYLLLDDYAGAVRVVAHNGFVESRVFDYGAASYNGGTTRVAKAVNTYGSTWNEDRSGQINSLQSQVNSLTAQIKSLKKKISAGGGPTSGGKKTVDKKIKTALQAELATYQSQLTSASGQLSDLQSATLRNETINYLQKIYKVISVFNNDQQV